MRNLVTRKQTRREPRGVIAAATCTRWFMRIVSSAGVPKGLGYSHFESKGRLLVGCSPLWGGGRRKAACLLAGRGAFPGSNGLTLLRSARLIAKDGLPDRQIHGPTPRNSNASAKICWRPVRQWSGCAFQCPGGMGSATAACETDVAPSPSFAPRCWRFAFEMAVEGALRHTGRRDDLPEHRSHDSPAMNAARLASSSASCD